MTLTFRDTLRKITPRWLQGYFGERVLYSIGVQLDALGDAATEAIKLRYPGLAPAAALQLIGKDRRIIRGIDEPDAVYAARLTRWLDDHSTRGGPHAMLGQLRARYAQQPFVIDLVYVTGRRFRLHLDGTIENTGSVWEPPDENLLKWARWWLFYQWPGTLAPTPTWGSGPTWGDGTIWGTSLSADELSSIRLIPTEWNAAHVDPRECRIVLLAGDGKVWGQAPPIYWGTGIWGEGTTATLPLKGHGR